MIGHTLKIRVVNVQKVIEVPGSQIKFHTLSHSIH